VDAHAGQLDKAGKPYILHPIRVMMTVEGPSLDSARKVAILHDVVEDSPWTVESLDAKFGLTSEEQAALRDNLDVTRLEEVTERDAKRITKYLRSLRRLTAGSGRKESL
jgi:(p)ppGpp synthase/HD superfamily hydrolase